MKKEQISQHLDKSYFQEEQQNYEVIISSKPGHDSIIVNFYISGGLDTIKKELEILGYNWTVPKIGDATLIATKHTDGLDKMNKKNEINAVKDLLQSYNLKVNVFSGANM